MAKDSSLDSWKLRRQESNWKFYTDLNDMRIEFGLPPKKYHLDLLEDEVFTRTIFIKIHNGIYAISGKELNKVFSTFGTLDTVEVFRHGHGFHSKVCFTSKGSTIRAFDFLNGRNIYDDCCTMELFLVDDFIHGQKEEDIVAESQNQDQVTLDLPPRSSSMEESTELQISPSLDINDRCSSECSDFRGGPTYYEIRNGVPKNDLNTVLTPTLAEELKEPDPSNGLVEFSASEPTFSPFIFKFLELQSLVVEDDTTIISSRDPVVLHLDQYPESVKKTEEYHDDCSLIDANIDKLKAIPNPLTMIFDVEPKEMGNSAAVSIIATESNVAYKVFEVKLPRKIFFVNPGGYGVIFDPGGVFDHSRLYFASGAVVLVNIVVELLWVFDPGGV